MRHQEEGGRECTVHVAGNLEGWGPLPEARLLGSPISMSLNLGVAIRTLYTNRHLLREHFEMHLFGPL